MGINRDKPDIWKEDIKRSVDFYNHWFMEFAPKAFRETRIHTAKQVEAALNATENLSNISVELLKKHPEILPILRMATCPPIARDRLVGLAGATKSLIENMEDDENPRVSPRMPVEKINSELKKISLIIERMIDPDIFTWISENKCPSKQELFRAATIVADRLCGAVSNPIIRNAQEKRQLLAIGAFLTENGYNEAASGTKFDQMKPGSFSFRTIVPVNLVDDNGEVNKVNIPIDAIVMPKTSVSGEFPLLIEAKSAGDFTNVNKRRKEEAQKMQQLRSTYGKNVRFALFLCGYFDSGYLGYEAAEGIDWVWEHRIQDLLQYNL